MNIWPVLCTLTTTAALATGAAAAPPGNFTAAAPPGNHTWTSLISLTSTGAQAVEYRSEPGGITADGRYVLFTSAAPNLAPGDTNETWDVFLRDRRARTTTPLSVTEAGVPADSSSYAGAITPDGSYVTITSDASNLVPGGTGGFFQVYLLERRTGGRERVSVSSTGAVGNGSSFGVSLSPDGRYVTFVSYADNLVPGDTNGAADVFLRDRRTGTTTLVSVSGTGVIGNGESTEASTSADGRFVAFGSAASNLVDGDSNATTDVFLRDRWAGTTRRVTVSAAGGQADKRSYLVTISADGSHVGYTSDAGNLVPGDTNGVSDIFVYHTGTATTERISRSTGGAQADRASYSMALSADGRFVAFTSDATNLVDGDTNATADVFLRDRRAGVTGRVSVSSAGTQAADGGVLPVISADGRYVAFSSASGDLVPGDTNGQGDVFLRRVR